jgi:PKD repeat protein
VGQSVQFTDTSTGAPTSWWWTFGDGGTSSAQHPNHTYSSAGTYTVTLQVSNAAGSDTASQSITVSQGGSAPNANFTWSPSSPQVGQSVQFTDTSSGSPTSWWWTFGDGGASTLQHPTHSYSSAATYAVTLQAFNNFGSDTITKNVTVSSGGSPVCSGTYVYVVPGGGHLPGALGTQWVSDLGIYNRGTGTASVTICLLERDADNSTVAAVSESIAAGASLERLDVFLNRFSENNLAGALWICSNRPLQVMSRTYNNDPVGTFGQGIPGYPLGDAITAGQTGTLTFLYENATYRSNVGFVNTTGGTITVTADFYNGSGNYLGTKNYSLRPYEYIQRSYIYRDVTQANITNGRIEVRCSTGGFFAYASMVDNGSGDPTFWLAVK